MSSNEDNLRREILGDAERRAERTVARARRDAEKMLADMRREHEVVAATRLAEAEVEAEARYRAMTAGIEHELRKNWLQCREAVFDEMMARALDQVENLTGIERRRSLERLLTEALRAMGPADVRVRANEACAAALEAEVVEAARQAAWGEAGAGVAVHIAVDPRVKPGLVVESLDGRLLFDNTYATRLARTRSEMRASLQAFSRAEEGNGKEHD